MSTQTNAPFFPSAEQVESLRAAYGTPLYVYDRATLEANAQAVTAFPNVFGLTPRYAMKALPTSAILRLLVDCGLHIDASSGYEAERALRAGVAPEKIQITAQEIPVDLKGLVQRGVLYNACSLEQVRVYGELFPGSTLSVRINPGLGSGHNNRTNVGGPGSSFGIWHEKIPALLDLLRTHDLKLTGMHTHIGSGGDPEVWQRCAHLSLGIAAQLPEVTRLSLGGGFKVARVDGEKTADLQLIGESLRGAFQEFAREHGRELHLEVEPGTYLVANAGVILASVIDVVDTHSPKGGGYDFIKVDTGMTELLRPNLYGAQHPIRVVARAGGELGPERDFVIAGHCCESGDVLTPAPGDPEALAPRRLPRPAIGDTVIVGGAGAYCSGLSGKNYNSFPEAAEVLIESDGRPRLIRKRQSLDQVLANELD